MNAESSAVQAMRRACDGLMAGDIAGYANELAENYLYEDRRLGLQSSHGKCEDVQQARVIADLGLEGYEMEVLETRGDRTALYRQTWQIGGFEVVVLLVGSVDAEGKAVAATAFDDEDAAGARAELEAQAADAAQP